MTLSLSGWLAPTLGLAIGAAIPLYAWWARGRTYGLFSAVILGLSIPGALVWHARVRGQLPPEAALAFSAVFLYLLLATGAHLSSLVRARMRGRLVRFGVSIPGMAFLALGALAGPWLLALLPVRGVLWLADMGAALSALRWLDAVPLLVVLGSLVTSLTLRREVVRVRLGGASPAELTRLPVERHRSEPSPPERRPLRIVQITDPHLGPWQSERRLRRRIEELLARDPDLVLLTGDFLTMEGNGTPGALARALEPLRKVAGRSFAVFGNHDHEAPEEVSTALAAHGVRLLVDEAEVVETPVGAVQILGADWYRRSRERRPKLEALFARHPRREGHLRILLLHDPLHFRDVPEGEADLTLSGHTHGGQVGLVSLGLSWTVLSRSRWPDHGLFGLGRNRLYVHRGTGFYGFPLRIGVPGEASLLELLPEAGPTGAATAG